MAEPAHAHQDSGARAEAAPGAAQRYLTFRLAGRHYALPAGDVAEIIHIPQVARLPLGPKALLGLANLRGTVIPVVDGSQILGLEAFKPGISARAIVLAGTGRIALAVDAVERIVVPRADQITASRPDLAAEAGEILLGAFQTDHDQTGASEPVTIRILDLQAMLGVAFGQMRMPSGKPHARSLPAARQISGSNAPSTDQRLLISFDVSGQDYALPLDAVREIIPLPSAISMVPRAEAVLLGVAAWRDTLLPLLSLRGLLGLAEAAAWSGAEKVLVTRVNGALVGLVADKARALIRADAASIDPAPAMLAARTGGELKITAIHRADGGRRLVSLLSPDLLFREDVMRRIGDKMTDTASSTAEPTDHTTIRIVVFRLGAEEFGLPIAAVDEVAMVPEQLIRVPKMPKFLEGVINLRGEVLPVVDQRRRFDMPAYSGNSHRRLIVVRSGRHRAGLIVDGVSEVLSTAEASIEPPPDLTGETAPLINGVINAPLTGRMILLLDPAELLTRGEHGALDRLDLPQRDSPTGQSDPPTGQPGT